MGSPSQAPSSGCRRGGSSPQDATAVACFRSCASVEASIKVNKERSNRFDRHKKTFQGRSMTAVFLSRKENRAVIDFQLKQ
jgi:hypothetical protein